MNSSEMVALPPEKLLENLKTFGRGSAVTSGHFETMGGCSVEDLDWNHMDQLHRPYIHRTYKDSLRLVRNAEMALSLTNVQAAGLRWPVLVTDVRLGPGLFYQSYTLLGLIYVHTVIRMIPRGEVALQTVDWHIVSHPWLKFLHGPLSRRLDKLNAVQNAEDVPIRECRRELRRKGYRFATDDPDFLNSNTVTNNVRAPALEGVHRLTLKGLPQGERGRVGAGLSEFLVRPVGDAYTFWTSVCPHEGGFLDKGTLTGSQIQCAWHGLKFPGLTLSPGRPSGTLCGLSLTLEGDDLVVRSAAKR